MKMIAAARLRRAEERVKRARPYAEKLQELIDRITSHIGVVPHPLCEERPIIHRRGIIVITSDRGLCGSFNTNIIKSATEFLKSKTVEETGLIIVGRKGNDFFKRRPWKIYSVLTNISHTLEYKEIKNIKDTACKLFLEGTFDEVWLVYSAYVSPAVCRVKWEKLLPIIPSEKSATEISYTEFIFQPSPKEILETLFPKQVQTKITLSLAESLSSEQGQRMVAMTAATDNAADMIYKLTLRYNKVRQASITKEISEIVGGAEALK